MAYNKTPGIMYVIDYAHRKTSRLPQFIFRRDNLDTEEAE